MQQSRVANRQIQTAIPDDPDWLSLSRKAVASKSKPIKGAVSFHILSYIAQDKQGDGRKSQHQ